MEQAELKGKAEGLAEKAVEVARNMKRKGLDSALISKMTGLSVSQIENL